MAIVDPVSDVRRPMYGNAATAAMFPPMLDAGYNMDLAATLVKEKPERITEPLIEVEISTG